MCPKAWGNAASRNSAPRVLHTEALYSLKSYLHRLLSIDFVVRGQARPEGVRRRSRAADQRAADGKKFGFWAPWRREAASCCPSRNLGAVAEIDGVAGALACGGRGLASPSIRTISSGMLDVKGDVCKTDEPDGRVDGVRAREQQRSSARMHSNKSSR